MSMQDITMPEVKVLPQNIRFYRDDDKDMFEISAIGDKNTFKNKVTPDIMTRFREEWNAYCDGRPLQRRTGLPLAEIMDEQRAEMLITRNVHNLNELAMLSDMQCQNLGHGTQTLREAAKKLMTQREAQEAERARKAIMDAAAQIGPRPADVPISAPAEIKELREQVSALAADLTTLVKLLTPKEILPVVKEADGENNT